MFLERRCPSCQRRSRFVCERCLSRFTPSGAVKLSGLDQVQSMFDYDESLGRVILVAKNQGRRDILRQFGRCMGGEVKSAQQFDVVTWVPASPANRRRRGFDQGLLLARSVAKHEGLPVRRLLTRRGDQQKGKDREQRLNGLQIWPVCAVPASVLIIDDVVTTGSSLRQSAEALRRGGGLVVGAMTIASTGWPAPGRE